MEVEQFEKNMKKFNGRYEFLCRSNNKRMFRISAVEFMTKNDREGLVHDLDSVLSLAFKRAKALGGERDKFAGVIFPGGHLEAFEMLKTLDRNIRGIHHEI